jgi:hypothetical protein
MVARKEMAIVTSEIELPPFILQDSGTLFIDTQSL